MLQAIVFLPLIAAILVGLTSRTIGHTTARLITCSLTLASAVLSGIIFTQVIFEGVEYIEPLGAWIHSGNLMLDWSLKADSLTSVMLVVVTWVSALVHIYSVGYMSHDKHSPRFMAYLSLFTFFMLVLVTANHFVQLFVGWEGVGLSSYLLIGFWYKKDSANAAAIKAFVVNRVGDFGMLLGLFAIFALFGTLDFQSVFSMAEANTGATFRFLGGEYHAITLICILLFIGAMGKSAQIGLHTWLPDAMEGPTPVSALIHAATMVTAGVFLVARCSPLFEHAPVALAVVTIVGAVTCLFAATIALTQNDIKKVIAYSTCSQLGYMFFACGVSAYSAGVFHLMTHAFFKALLFLGAGSVIHAMSDEQDMRKMGGIWKKIPFTYAMMLVGTIAIIGWPPLSGYFSKDMILESAYGAGEHGNRFGYFAYWMGIAAACLTSLYSWRLIIMTFHGKPRADEETMHHIHESPLVMTLPLLLLALGAVFAGMVGYYMLGMVNHNLEFWRFSLVHGHHAETLEAAHHVPKLIQTMPLIVGMIGFVIAYICYFRYPELPARIAAKAGVIYRFLYNKWYVDELYDFLFVQPAKRLGKLFWKVGDVFLIDGFGPNGAATASRFSAGYLSRFQTGYLYHYAFVMLIGLAGLIGWYLYGKF